MSGQRSPMNQDIPSLARVLIKVMIVENRESSVDGQRTFPEQAQRHLGLAVQGFRMCYLVLLGVTVHC